MLPHKVYVCADAQVTALQMSVMETLFRKAIEVDIAPVEYVQIPIWGCRLH